MGKRHIRRDGDSKRSFVYNLLTWSWVLLTMVVSTILISACSSGDADSPQTLIVVWNSNEDLGNAGTDDDIFFSRSTDGGETWATLQVLNSNTVSDGMFDQDYFPQTMTDGEGNWVAVWNYYDLVTDIDISFSRSTDGGVTWSDQQALNSNAAQAIGADNDNRPNVLSYGADMWIAVWQSREDLNDAGIDYDIFFSRSTDDGATWSASQALNSNTTTDTGNDLFGHEE